MTQPPNDCPIAQWLTSVGYTGATRGAMATLYPEDVARLAMAVDAKVESACATWRDRHAKVTAHAESIIAAQQRTVEAQAKNISYLQAEIASLRDGGKIKPLEPSQAFLRNAEDVAKLRDQLRGQIHDAFYIDPSGFLTPGVNGKQNP